MLTDGIQLKNGDRIMKEDKCKYCYYNTVASCSEDPSECENYEFNHLAEKYELKRFKAEWEDGNDVRVTVTDELDKFPKWYFETVEDAEELADFMNDLWQESQDIQDRYCSAILNLMEKYFKLKCQLNNVDMFDEKINVLEELLHEVGDDDLIVDFYNSIAEEIPDDDM